MMKESVAEQRILFWHNGMNFGNTNPMKKHQILWEWLMIVCGSLLLALGIRYFLLPLKLTTGGVGGLATLLYYLGKIPLSLTVFLANLVLFILGIRSVRLGGIIKSLGGIALLSFFLSLPLPPFSVTDPMLAALYGGVLEGLGVGITLAVDSSTGGTDFLVLLIRKRFPSVTAGKLLLWIDGGIILLSGVALSYVEGILYSLVALFISARVVDLVLVEGGFAKAVLVVSRESRSIARRIQTTLFRGVTAFYTRGCFSGTDGETLLCVVKTRQVPKVLDLVKEEDPDAFSVILDVRHVRGEGFD